MKIDRSRAPEREPVHPSALMSLRDVAELWGCSLSYVQQVESRALWKLFCSMERLCQDMKHLVRE